MIEIAENLHRSELTALKRDEQLAEWIELANDGNLQLTQIAPIEKSKREDGRGHRQEGGVRAASRELNVDRDDARRAAKIGSITPEAKEAARPRAVPPNADYQ